MTTADSLNSDYGETCILQLKHAISLYAQWSKMNNTAHDMWMRTFFTRMKDCIAAGRGEEARELVKKGLPKPFVKVVQNL